MRKRLAKALFNVSEEDLASKRTFYHSMELLLVGVVALAVGFFAADYLKPRPVPLKTDANAQRPAGTIVPPDTSPPLKPSGEVDPSIKRPEKGTDQHG
jgi:hypothetical protein